MNSYEKITKVMKRSIYYFASHAAVFVVLLGIFGLVFVMWVAGRMPTPTPTCYNGHLYRVDSQGVMWPIQMKYGVQKCQPGDDDVSK